MTEFVRYYWEFLQLFFKSIGDMFVGLFNFFANHLFKNPIKYFGLLGEYDFNFLDWLIYIIVALINVALFAGFVYLMVRLLKRYIKFASREIDKDKLEYEIIELTEKLLEVTEEKNKILNLKMENLGFTGHLLEGKNKDEVGPSRFVKLVDIDKTYESYDPEIIMEEKDKVTLEELVKRFVNYAAINLKLYYPEKVIASFFAGMSTSKLMILEGISGTGKTSLPYAMGKFFGFDAFNIPVQPSWRDRAEMMGYLNEFTKRFNESDFLAALYETTYRKDINFIILDELNLARVEYYFAEFLSIMEMPNAKEWMVDVVPDTDPADPKHLVKGKVEIPQHVWFVGTANKDDSTFTITDKVYDRAISIEMNAKAEYIDAPSTEGITMRYDYLMNLFDQSLRKYPLSDEAEDKLVVLGDFIASKFKIAFGNRVLKQIRNFIPVFVGCGRSEVEGLDYMIARKVIRKFETLNLPFLQEELNELLTILDKLFGKTNFSECRSMIKDYQKQM